MKRNERLSAKDRKLLKETLKELNRQGRLQEEKLAKQHGSTSVYQHSINVAYLSLWLAGRLPLRTEHWCAGRFCMIIFCMTGIRRMTGIAGMDFATEKQRRETQNGTIG